MVLRSSNRETKKTFTKYMANIDKVLQERAGQQETLDVAISTRRSLHLAMTDVNANIAEIMKMKLRHGVSESGTGRSTWGDMSDEEIREATNRLEALRIEKAGLTKDINDYKESINDLNDVVESYEASIQSIVSLQLAESDVGTANPKEKTLSEIAIDKFCGELTKEALLSADKPSGRRRHFRPYSLTGHFPARAWPPSPSAESERGASVARSRAGFSRGGIMHGWQLDAAACD